MTLTEQVFRKMRWEEKTVKIPMALVPGRFSKVIIWISPEGKEHAELPPIDSSWEVTTKYLVPFMRERGYEYDIDNATHYWWLKYSISEFRNVRQTYAEIKDDNIAEAACKAFMEVSLD